MASDSWHRTTAAMYGAFRIQRTVDWLFVVRCALGMVVGVAGGYATGTPMAAVVGGFTALGTGMASQQGFYRTRLTTMIAVTLAMTLCTTIGFLTGHSPLLSILVLAVCGYIYGITASFGAAASAIGIWAVLSLIIFGHLPVSTSAMSVCALTSLTSGAVQILLLVATWPLYRYPQERRALVDVYCGLASYARGEVGPDQLLEQSESFRKLRAILADPQPFGRPITMTALQTLLDEAERVRATLAELPPNDAGVNDDRSVAADVLNAIAASVDSSRAPTNQALRNRLDAPSADPAVRALFGQLRAAWRMASIPWRGFSLRTPVNFKLKLPIVREAFAFLRQNASVHTSFGRHALRLAVVLAIARTLEHVVPFERGYWITLTAAVVLRPDFTTTFVRAIGRIMGTIAGVVAATAIVVAVPNTPYVDLALAALFGALTFAAVQVNTTIFGFVITEYVVFIVATLGQPEHAEIINRGLASVSGGLLGMLAYVLWPTWESPATRGRIVTLLERLRSYMLVLFEGLADPARRDVRALNALRDETWRARAAANESLERMLSEPNASRQLSDETALGIMAASRRVEFANLELWGLYEDPSTPALPQVSCFSEAVDAALESDIRLLCGPHGMRAPRSLRGAYESMKASLGNANSPAVQVLLDAGDRLADSVNTISALVAPQAGGSRS
ncbi:MAG: FUSC family protein [Candidatus Eremiobacteraeota bacterium]|nr:FUSC family protein [Candidatus Eremiobacteraeota bacterium]